MPPSNPIITDSRVLQVRGLPMGDLLVHLTLLLGKLTRWVVIDGHMWFSLLSVEIHIWTCQAGRLQIELDHLDSNEYAVRCGLKLIKEDIFQELVTTNVDQSLLDRMEAWLPPPLVC
ncbi:hypothetical protein BKA83DRAFT_4128917 [Pisolithus microcarpus]|nr:hypothetical protein BKA83DRAFT_4128917 [Pisolithus microcarpus]